MDCISLGSLGPAQGSSQQSSAGLRLPVLHADKMSACTRLGHPVPCPGYSHASVPTGSAPAGPSACLESYRRAQLSPAQPSGDRGNAVMAASFSPAWVTGVGSALRQLLVPQALANATAAPAALPTLHGHLPAQNQGCVNNVLEK